MGDEECSLDQRRRLLRCAVREREGIVRRTPSIYAKRRRGYREEEGKGSDRQERDKQRAGERQEGRRGNFARERLADDDSASLCCPLALSIVVPVQRAR